MNRLLAKVDSKEKAADRVKELQKQFSDFEFDAVKVGDDTRTEIRLVNVRPGVDVDEPKIEQMKRVATGAIPAPKEKKAINKATAEVVKNQTVGTPGSPAGGGAGPAARP